MDEQPLVSVNILSFNRKDELRTTLSKVYEQDYKNIEVIVVDNASIDGSSEMVKTEFPDVQLICLEKNIGIAGWNEGFKVAKGEYVLVLDDDAYPDKLSLSLSIEKIKNNPSIGIVAFNVFNILKNNEIHRFPGGWLPDPQIEECKWNYFIGCTFLLRRNVFINNLFPPSYFICFHESPILRVIAHKNLFIFYNKSIKAFHQNQTLKGLSPTKEYYHFRNLLNFILWNFSIPSNLFYGSRIILFFLTRSIKHGWFINYLIACGQQFNNFQNYKLEKLNLQERRIFLQTEFVEYRLSNKFRKV